LAAATPAIVRVRRALLAVPALVLSAMVGGFAAAAQAAVDQVFVAVEASEAVQARLGGPVMMLPADQVVWEQPSVNAPSDTLSFHFFVAGPRGAALVSATLRPVNQKFVIEGLIVAPLDGGGSIAVMTDARD
jgi:hypothetical protein